MTKKPELQPIKFLQQELSILAEAISLIMRRQETPLSQIPIQLWQRGLITIQQLEQIFDCQEQVSV
jgi:hypothetical protein